MGLKNAFFSGRLADHDLEESSGGVRQWSQGCWGTVPLRGMRRCRSRSLPLPRPPGFPVAYAQYFHFLERKELPGKKMAKRG